MDFRRLGDSGLAVSVVGMGTNNFGLKLDMQQCREVVHASLDEGITLFDTADSYGASEQRLGELLEGQRDDVIIATKFGSNVRAVAGGPDNGADWQARGARRYIRRAVEGSLRRLRTDWIDLYQLHLPDPLTPIEETLSTLSDVVREGKIRYLGHSNFTAWMTADADWTARTRGLERFISAQNRYNLLDRDVEAELIPAMLRYGIGMLPYAPLAGGLLSGKYRRGQAPPPDSRVAVWHRESMLTDENFDRIEALEEFAKRAGISVLEVAIGGLAAKPTVASVIAGATSAEQVKANVLAGQWRPSTAEQTELDEITKPD
jgi:aryl-alcohol dehydrogenase-like predicted oxidoreductase